MQADWKALTEGLSDPRRELRMGASEVMKGLSTLAHAALGGALGIARAQRSDARRD